ncbi:MAG: hypothetical protein JNL39_13360 [Opitutaceae bacterium]|nr:hypothetical protein [Opitutaceae bacterium]
MPNPVIRWQIITPEADQAAGFYKKLFAWDLSTANALGYRELRSGEARGADGGVWPAPPGKPSFVQLQIEVADIDAAIGKATKLGASVIMPKSVLPEGDAMAVLLDPAGISFVICQLQRRG